MLECSPGAAQFQAGVWDTNPTAWHTHPTPWGVLAMVVSLIFRELNKEKTNQFRNSSGTLPLLSLVLGSASDDFGC